MSSAELTAKIESVSSEDFNMVFTEKNLALMKQSSPFFLRGLKKMLYGLSLISRIFLSLIKKIESFMIRPVAPEAN